jgi:hypothetical protein
MGLEYAMLLAEVTVAETAVADDTEGSLLAFLEVATRLLGRRHAEGVMKVVEAVSKVKIYPAASTPSGEYNIYEKIYLYICEYLVASS